MSMHEQQQFLPPAARVQVHAPAAPVAAANQYDFRPDAGGRSLGELAWHLAEIDAYLSAGVAARNIDFSVKLPGLERPRKVSELADAYARVHAESAARITAMRRRISIACSLSWPRDAQR